MRHLYELVDLIRAHRGNHLQLYFEHAFRYAGHEEVSDGASPITPDELQRLDDYASARGVALGANQNCLGHLTRWLGRARYAPLAETHSPFLFDDMKKQGPFSLCPVDPESLRLVCDLLDQQMNCVSSPVVNIGCDEAFDIGTGASRQAVRAEGYAKVFGQYVGAVVEHVSAKGGRAAFWADGVTRYPDALDWIGPEAIALVWGYEPDAPFETGTTLCRRNGREVWVCPGTSAWRSILGRTSERRANLARAVRDGLGAGASGLIICEWGDNGHLQPWPIVRHAIAEALDAAWTGEVDPGTTPHQRATTEREWSSSRSQVLEPELGTFLDQLGDVDLELRNAMRSPGCAVPLANAGALFTVLWPARAGYTYPNESGMWARARTRLVDLSSDLPGNHLERDELGWAIRLMVLAAEVGLWIHARGPEPKDWRGRLHRLETEHRRLWRVRSRIGGLAESCQFFSDLETRLGEFERSGNSGCMEPES